MFSPEGSNQSYDTGRRDFFDQRSYKKSGGVWILTTWAPIPVISNVITLVNGLMNGLVTRAVTLPIGVISAHL